MPQTKHCTRSTQFAWNLSTLDMNALQHTGRGLRAQERPRGTSTSITLTSTVCKRENRMYPPKWRPSHLQVLFLPSLSRSKSALKSAMNFRALFALLMGRNGTPIPCDLRRGKVIGRDAQYLHILRRCDISAWVISAMIASI